MSRTPRGYNVEAAFDVGKMGLTPAKGLPIGFDLAVDDADADPQRECQIMWRGAAGNFRDTRGFARAALE